MSLMILSWLEPLNVLVRSDEPGAALWRLQSMIQCHLLCQFTLTQFLNVDSYFRQQKVYGHWSFLNFSTVYTRLVMASWSSSGFPLTLGAMSLSTARTSLPATEALISRQVEAAVKSRPGRITAPETGSMSRRSHDTTRPSGPTI